MPETKNHEPESRYAPPLAAVGVEGVYRARTWYLWLTMSFFGGLAALMLGLGMVQFARLFWAADQGQQQARMAGVTLTAFGLGLGALAGFGGVHIVARRGPALRAYREGVEIRLIGPSGVYGIPSAPRFGRLAWALLSGGRCRLPMLRIPWAEVSAVMVTGGTWSRTLAVHWETDGGRESRWVLLHQSEVAAVVDGVARALRAWAWDEDARKALPGWEDPA